MADFMGIIGGYGCYSVIILESIMPHTFCTQGMELLSLTFSSGVFKSAIFFGAIIAVVSCYQGFNGTGG